MKKKVLSMLVTFAMLLSMLPATALAADFNVTADGNDLDGADSADFYTFDEVLSQATVGDQIIIKENVTADEAFTVTDVTIDLGGNKLTVGAGGNYFKGNVVVKNGTIDITDVTASGDCIMGIGDRNADATLTLEDVNLTGSDYSSAFAVLMVYGNGTLNVKGGEWNLSDDQSTAGGVIKNESGAGDSGNVNITGTTMQFADVERGIAGATVVLDDVDLTITGGDNGINGSKLTVKDSDITITGGAGRALTVTDYDVSVENSTLNLSGNGEADIRFKTDNTLTVDAASTLSECTVIADGSTTTAKVNSYVVTGTESAPQSVAVTGGVTSIKAAPKGTVTPAYTEETKFWGEGTANATESFVVELYEGSTKIASSSLINKDNIINGDVYVTWSIPFDGVDSDNWDVEWASGYPKYDMNPDAVKLVVDGTTVATNNVYFNAPDNLNKIVALAEGNTGGVKAYTTLADAMGNFNGRKVNVLRDVTESIAVMNGCTLTTNVIGGVTITSTYDKYVYANDLNIGNGVTVKAGNFFYETDGVNAVEGTLEVEEVFYHGYDAKTTVQNGGSIKVSGTTILRYNENEASGLYIYGDDDESTVEFDCAYYIGAYSGTFYAEDANVECGYFLLKPSYDTEEEDANTKYPPMDVTLDNSTITVTGTTDGQNSFQIDDQAILTLQNGSAIKGVCDFNILTGAQPSISVDGTSSVSATNVNIADDVAMEATKNSDGTVTFAKKLSGEGTESDPYVINTLEELKNFRDNVNNGNNYSNKYVELGDNINLAGEAWTPIGTTESPFNGNFNGNNKTISNLVVNGGSSDDQGFFGRTNDGTIGNLTIDNAKVSGRLNVGVVAGTPYTSEYTNIKVTGHVEVNGMAYVGGVGGKNAYANWTDITVVVDDTSYVKATSTESGTAYRTYVGGVVGFNGEGSHTFKNIDSNIDVIGDVCDVGGVFGIAHYGNKFENIACSGNVTNTSSDPEAALETGLIAGVWHNEAGYSVTFNGCSAEGGTVSTPNADVTLPNNGLIGAAYETSDDTDSTSGTLIVDKEKKWPLVAEVNGVKYGTLSAAIAAAEAGDVVTLLNDAIEVVEIKDGAATIDLNNNTLTGSFLIKSGEFEIKNGSIVNEDSNVSGVEINAGALTLTDVNVTSSRHALRVDGEVDVTVDGGEYKVSESAGMTTHAVNVSDGGFVIIQAGTFTGPKGLTVNDSGSAVCVQANSSVVITGGTFSGGKNDTLSSKGTLTVAGGEFDQDPEPYLAEGYLSYQSPSNHLYYVRADDGAEMVASVNGVKHKTLEAAVNAAKDGDTVVILQAGTYTVPTGKDLTITGAVDGVVFDDIGAKNMGGADVTFNNVTFDYCPNTTYTGLQHSGNLIYNDCTFNGQVFLYGTSETFNNCTFNQNSADAYNVWTYGAKAVKFNECTFNSVGRSVLVYNEGAGATDLTVTDTDFIATSAVKGKAAIEIDTSLMPEGTNIVIDATTIATGFDKGSISGNELWNDKKDQTNLTVTVGGEKVWPKGKAEIDHGFQTIIDNSKSRESITTTLKNVYASESLVLKIYSGETLLGTTTLREYEDGDTSEPLYPATYDECTVNNVITGEASGSWETAWVVDLTRKNVPTKIEVYADGVLTDTYVDPNGCFLNDEEKAEYIELFDLTFTVTFDTDGGSSVDAQEVVSGKPATRPATAPTKSGYTFVNWYSDEALTTVFDFSAPITKDTTVYAKWSRNSSGGGGGGGSTRYTITVEDTENGDITVSPSRASSGSTVTITVDPDSGYELDELTVLDKNGKEIKLTRKSDSKYTFKMPSGKVTIEATFAEIEAFENPFTDVAEGAYYYDAVLWAAENGITGGTSATTFSPAVTCTRAQTVTFLWRAAGSPEPETTVCPFTDVTPDKYYYDAVLWAVENGITSGTSATTFSPNATVTRAQNVTFLWRWAESSAVEAVNPFTDVAADMYYHDAVLWAADEGITAGTSATTFSPDDPCLRSQIVTFLYRYLVK